MTQLELKTKLEKITSIAKELEKTMLIQYRWKFKRTFLSQKGWTNDEFFEVKKRNALEVANQLKKVKKDDVQLTSSCIKSKNPISIYFSQSDLNVKGFGDEVKIEILQQYVEELIGDLDKLSEVKFELSGIYHMGGFIRRNEKCCILLSWKFF